MVKRNTSRVFFIILLVFSIYFLKIFLTPYFTAGIKNIGNLTGITLSVAGIVISLLHTYIYRKIKLLWQKKLGKIFILTLTFAISIICVFAVIITVCMWRASKNKPEPNVTLVVLGCRVYGTSPSIMLKERLDAAYDYLCDNEETVCILSGGMGDGENISEAECMYRYLVNRGIDSKRLYKEDKSTSTRENILYSKQIIDENNLNKKIAIVTNEFHQYRAFKIAKKLGVKSYAVNGKTADWLFPTFYIREMWGIMYEWFL